MKSIKPDVCVIGAGIIGNSIALGLQRKGFKVNVYDSNSSPGFGTTSYSSGICRMYYSLLDSIKLAWEGYHHFQNWGHSLNLNDNYDLAKINNCGTLIFKSDKSKDFIKHTSCMMRSIGIEVQELDFIETQEKIKNLGMDINYNYETLNPDHSNFGNPKSYNDITGSIYMPESGYVGDPQLAAKNLFEAAEIEGVNFNFNSKIIDILVENNNVKGIELEKNIYIESPIVINAAGPYSTHINNLIYNNTEIKSDININCKPLRIEVSYTDNLENMENMDTEKVNHQIKMELLLLIWI